MADASSPPDPAPHSAPERPGPARRPGCRRTSPRGEVREWQRLLAIGAIPGRDPPAAPDVAAVRAANDALFRRLAPPRLSFVPSRLR